METSFSMWLTCHELIEHTDGFFTGCRLVRRKPSGFVTGYHVQTLRDSGVAVVCIGNLICIGECAAEDTRNLCGVAVAAVIEDGLDQLGAGDQLVVIPVAACQQTSSSDRSMRKPSTLAKSAIRSSCVNDFVSCRVPPSQPMR